MGYLHNIFAYIIHIIDILAVVILVIGVIKVVIKYSYIEIKKLRSTPIHEIQRIRCELGVYILLALDLLIAKDIIHTVTDLSQERLIELGVLIVLRTIIGYFIGKEVESIENEDYIES